jgi:hypothetical protein
MLTHYAPVLGIALFISTPSVFSADLREIQMRRLLEPTPAELASEKDGRIYIYESLTNPDIEKAMSEEFDRVESMMFIRVPKTDASGAVKKDEQTGDIIYEDDGC